MPIYDLPIWAHDRDEFPDRGIGGPGWRVRTRNVSFESNADEEAHFLAMRERYPHYAVTKLGFPDDVWRIAPQVFVEANSRIVAQRVGDLLRAALCLLDDSDTQDPGELLALPHDLLKLEDLNEYSLLGNDKTIGRDGVLVATRLAAKCSRRKPLRYALLKLNLSFQIASTHWMNLHPRGSPKNFRVESDPKVHVALASAVTLAYSAIEELQLEPRSVKNRPVKNADGRWDPSALEDLNARLEEAQIDVQDPLPWTVRGSSTRIHRSKRAPSGDKQSWSRGIVRDTSISVQDALIAVSWLRSKCTTHRYGRETASITMFDVHNVQHLARRLILETVGLWPPFGR